MTHDPDSSSSSRIVALPQELQESAVRRAIIAARKENEVVELKIPHQGIWQQVIVYARDTVEGVISRLKGKKD